MKMSIDELAGSLTDNDFWSAYKDPKLDKLFEPYLIRHKAHPSQKGQSGYNPDNRQWYSEAKEDPKIIEAARNLKASKNSSKWLLGLTPRQSAAGFATATAAIVMMLAGLPPYVP